MFSDESPYFIAPNADPQDLKLSEYNSSWTSYSGILGIVSVRDPDVYNNILGDMTLSIVSVINDTDGSALPTDAFYMASTNAKGAIITYLMFDTSLCTPDCLYMFNYLATGTIWQINLQVADGGGLIDTASYRVEIVEFFEDPYYLNLPASVNVTELDFGPNLLYTVQGAQANGLPITYTLVAVNPPSGSSYFDLLSTCTVTGVECADLNITSAVVTETFNFYAVPVYRLTFWAVVTTSGGDLTTTGTLTVSVQIVNRQPVPIQASGSMSISEFQTTPYCFRTISAIDRESDAILYNLANVSSSSIDFIVNSTTGEICYLDTSRIGDCCTAIGLEQWIFNYNTETVYTFEIEVYDAESTLTRNTFSFTLSINYKNRHPTIDSIANPSHTVYVCSRAGTVNTLYATDPEDDKITFDLYNPTTDILMFSMDTTIPNPSGATPAESEITYQAPPAFNISASPLNMSFYITDGEWTVTSTFSVLTYILECDTAPEFTNMPNFTTIDENVTGINYFFTASIYDPDLPSDTNEDFQFLLSNGTLTSAYDEWIISSAGRKNYSSQLFATFVKFNIIFRNWLFVSGFRLLC